MDGPNDLIVYHRWLFGRLDLSLDGRCDGHLVDLLLHGDRNLCPYPYPGLGLYLCRCLSSYRDRPVHHTDSVGTHHFALGNLASGHCHDYRLLPNFYSSI